jgi:hypothetical protein
MHVLKGGIATPAGTVSMCMVQLHQHAQGHAATLGQQFNRAAVCRDVP